MGKFDGILFASDFDATLTSSPPENHFDLTVSEENQAAIKAFMAQGGTFIVASGRGHATFLDYAHLVPNNGPASFANGGEIYDLTTRTVIASFTLPETARAHLQEVIAAIPELGFEFYTTDSLTVLNLNDISKAHLERMDKSTWQAVSTLDEVPDGWCKVLLEQERPYLEQAKEYINSRWGDLYECIFSHDRLLELNARGVNKGASVVWIAEHLGIDRDHIYCIGDNENDLSMLAVSKIPFAPANAVPAVRAVEGVRLMPHHNEHAVAAALAELDRIIS